METISIIYMIFIGIICLLSVWLNSKQKAMIQAYKEALAHNDKFNNALFKYCLSHIIKEATKKEDYETSLKCNELLKQIKD